MGFGLLLIGYFVTFAFSVSQNYFFADIIGSLIMIFAFTKLDQYNKYFSRASIASIVFALLCAVNAASLIFEIYSPSGMVDMVIDTAKQLAACLIHVFIFMGTHGIAMKADSDKLVKNTDRSFTMTMIYYAFSVIVIVLSSYFGDYVQYASAVVYLYWLMCLLFNLVLFYKCFAILCPADEDENAVKRSRFAIINKINDKMESMEQKTNEYRAESMKMALDEADRRAAEKSKNKNHNNNHHKKKKK